MSEKKNRTGAIILYAILAALIAVIVFIVATKQPPAPVEKPAEQAVPVTAITVRARTVPDLLKVPGRIEADVDVQLALEKPGVVIELGADKGQEVKKGQLLLRIDDRAWKLMVEKAELDLREARKDLDRWDELKKTGAVSVNDYEDIRTKKELAEIAISDGRLQLEKCALYSPIAGMVANRFVEVGEYMKDGEPAFTVVKLDPAKLVLDIPERDVAALKTGDAIPFELDALPGQSFTGTVSFVSPSAYPDSNAFRVEALAPNGDARLKPGMIARVKVARRARENALAVPLNAVVPKQGEHVVFVVENGRAVRRLVKIDAIVDRDAILASGLRDGEQVVVEGNRTLVDGMPVAVTTASD